MSHEKGDRTFAYSSPSSISHTLIHGLNTLSPAVTVIDDSTGTVVLPAEILVLDADSIDITFFVAKAIRGTIR